jgi:hypothetical protein
MDNALTQIRIAAAKEIFYSHHARTRMNEHKPRIDEIEIEQVIWQGEIVEDYPEDLRGHSCLLVGRGLSNRPLHVVCAPKHDLLVIITVYVPDSDEWDAAFKRRLV